MCLGAMLLVYFRILVSLVAEETMRCPRLKGQFDAIYAGLVAFLPDRICY
jgi:hypothetical protein